MLKRSTSRWAAAAAAACALAATPAAGHAQILQRIKHRVQERVEQAAGTAVDHAVDAASQKVQGSGQPTQGQTSTPAASDGSATPTAQPTTPSQNAAPAAPAPGDDIELMPLTPQNPQAPQNPGNPRTPQNPQQPAPPGGTDDIELLPLTPPDPPGPRNPPAPRNPGNPQTPRQPGDPAHPGTPTPPGADDVELLPLTPRDPPGPRRDPAPDVPDHVRQVNVRVMSPFSVMIRARVVDDQIPDCAMFREWRGRLTPSPDGTRVTGVLHGHDWYDGRGCKIVSSGSGAVQVHGVCEGGTFGDYDFRAAVSGVEMPDKVEDGVLSEFAAGKATAWTHYQMQGGGWADGDVLRKVIRTRLRGSIQLKRGTLHGANNCIDQTPAGMDGWDEALSRVALDLPPLLLPTERERNGVLLHDLGGGNSFAVGVTY